MRLFLCLAIVIVSLFASGNDALAQYSSNPQIGAAQGTSNVYDSTGCAELRANSLNAPTMVEKITKSGGTICPCTPKPSLWLERMVSCFAEVPGGLIYESMKSLLDPSSPYKTFYNTLISASVLLAVVLFGLKMVFGSLQSVPKESFTLVLKIGGIALFFNNYLGIYGDALNTIQGLAEIVGTAAGNIGNVCDSDVNDPTLWARWDCLFRKFTGFVGGYMGVGAIAFVTALLFSGGMGVAIFIGIGYVLMTLLLISMRLVYTYLVAIMAVSFLFLLAPIFVPLVLFGQTYSKFTTWFKIILVYMLQPMMISLFMVLMLTALEFSIFVGPTSLYGAISNSSPSKASTFTNVMSGNTGSAGSGGYAPGFIGPLLPVTSSDDWTNYVKQMPIFEFIRHTDSSVNTTNQSQNDAINTSGTDTGVFGNQATTASNSAGEGAAGSYEGGYRVPKVDFEGLWQYLAPRLQAISQDQWLKNIILQVLASGILIFILYNLVHALPQITHDLVSQRFGSAFGGATKARMIGESEIRKSMEAGKEIARRGNQTGDISGSVSGVLSEVADSYVGKR